MTAPVHTSAHVLAQRITVLRIDKIHPHPGNIRDDLGDLSELAASIRQHGLLQPIVVTPHPDLPATYQLLAGHRRLAAAKRTRLDAVPAIVRHGIDDNGALELMLVENCQRADLNPVEKAEALDALRKRGYTHAKIAEKTGMKASTVSYFLALMDLAPQTRERVRTGHLTVSEAVAAVRTVRKRERKKRGSTATYEWEPDILADSHPLAKKARRMCDARDHGMRRRIGKTACGQCWETVIRLDERVVIEAEEADT